MWGRCLLKSEGKLNNQCWKEYDILGLHRYVFFFTRLRILPLLAECLCWWLFVRLKFYQDLQKGTNFNKYSSETQTWYHNLARIWQGSKENDRKISATKRIIPNLHFTYSYFCRVKRGKILKWFIIVTLALRVILELLNKFRLRLWWTWLD